MNGLVLQGGGAKGSYHVGVWKALRELGEEIHVVTGTSIGALNGVMIVQDRFDESYDLWYNIEPSMLFDIDSKLYHKMVDLEFDADLFSSSIKYLKTVFNNGGLDITPLRKLIAEKVDEEKVRKSKIDFGLVTVSITDLEPVEVFIKDIPVGKLPDYLLASARLPFFKMEKLDGKVYLDGGFYDNQPVSLMLKKEGIKKLILVENKGVGIVHKVDTSNYEVIRIKPSSDTGRTLEITRERSRENLLMGYYDTMKIYKNYLGEKYYLESFDEEKIFYEIYHLPQEKIDAVSKILGFDAVKSKRHLLEKIIPEVGKILKISLEADYSALFIATVETTAEYLKINRYQILTFKQLIVLIKEKLIENGKEAYYENQKLIDKILKQGNIVTGNHKSEMIVEIMSILLID